jgi:hypothetical protein
MIINEKYHIRQNKSLIFFFCIRGTWLSSHHTICHVSIKVGQLIVWWKCLLSTSNYLLFLCIIVYIQRNRDSIKYNAKPINPILQKDEKLDSLFTKTTCTGIVVMLELLSSTCRWNAFSLENRKKIYFKDLITHFKK